MEIKEAIEIAMQKNAYVTRRQWNNGVVIEPTNTDKCCIIHKKGRSSANRWNPKAEDLTANDWIATDII